MIGFYMMGELILNGVTYGTKYSRMDQLKFCGRQPLQVLKGYGLLEAARAPSNFLKAVFHKLHLVHS